MPDDGNAISLTQAGPFVGDQEWAIVETVTIRFNATESGRFPAYFYKEETGVTVGYDAAVCLQKYEPWIVEAYNTSFAPPSLFRIVEKGNVSTSPLPSGNIRGAPILNTRYLNTTGKNMEFWGAQNNVVHQILKVNDGGYNYIPTPPVGPAPTCNISPNLNLPHRPFLSPEVLDLRDSLNSRQTGSPSSAGGSVRLTLCHILRAQHPSSRNRTRMRR